MPFWNPYLSTFLIHALLVAAVPILNFPRNRSLESADGIFAEFTKPLEGDTLVTGSVVEVRWKTDGGNGQAILEVAQGRDEPKNFVYVDYDVDYASGNHTWAIPETLYPGSYVLRLANSTDPSIFADSPVFRVIHAAPTPTSSPEPPERRDAALSREDIVGLGIGLGIAAVLGVCVIWLWWRKRRTTCQDSEESSGSRRICREDTDNFATEGGLKDEGELPVGLVSAWAPEERIDPIELPAEGSGASRDDPVTREAREERLELSGSAKATYSRGENTSDTHSRGCTLD